MKGKQWVPGDAPSQVMNWDVRSLAKAGTLSIIGAYPETKVLTQVEGVMSAIDAYKEFDKRTTGWIKVELKA